MLKRTHHFHLFPLRHAHVSICDKFEFESSIAKRVVAKMAHLKAYNEAFGREEFLCMCLYQMCNHEKVDQLSNSLSFL